MATPSEHPRNEIDQISPIDQHFMEITDPQILRNAILTETRNRIASAPQDLQDRELARLNQTMDLAEVILKDKLRDGGAPEIVHPYRVMLRFLYATKDDPTLDAAYLCMYLRTAAAHDIYEDIPQTYDEMFRKFGQDVADNVKVLSKKSAANPNEKKDNIAYYNGILNSEDPYLLLLKISDRWDNLNGMLLLEDDMAQQGTKKNVTERKWNYVFETEAFYLPIFQKLHELGYQTEAEKHFMEIWRRLTFETPLPIRTKLQF